MLLDSFPSGTIVVIDESAGIISKNSYIRTINSGNTKTYYTDIDYMAEVVVGNKIRQVKISEQEYWQYKIGMDVILVPKVV